MAGRSPRGQKLIGKLYGLVLRHCYRLNALAKMGVHCGKSRPKSRWRPQSFLRLSPFRPYRARFETLEPRLVLACEVYIDGDYSSEDDSTWGDQNPVVKAQLCYTGDVTLTAKKSINIQADIESKNGSVTIEAPSITVSANITAYEDLTLEADTTRQEVEKRNLVSEIQDLIYSLKDSSSLDITITGSSNSPITLTSKNGDVSITAENKVNDWRLNAGISPSDFTVISAMLQEVFEVPDLTSLPLTVQVWKPSATINLTNAKITSSDELTITAEADSEAIGKAVYNRIMNGSDSTDKNLLDMFPLAFGYFYSEATATISLIKTKLSSAGAIEVTTEVTNLVELEVETIRNSGVNVGTVTSSSTWAPNARTQDTTNLNAAAAAVGVTSLSTTSWIKIDEDSVVTSAGPITISASAENESGNDVFTSIYTDGTAAASIAYSTVSADVHVHVDGTVTSSQPELSESDSEPLSFGTAADVDYDNNRVRVTNTNGYTTSDLIFFSADDGGSIPGLVPDTFYYLIVVDSTHVQFAATADDAEDGNAIPLGPAFPTLTDSNNASVTVPIKNIQQLETDTTASDGTTTTTQHGLILLGYKPELSYGTQVIFTPVSSRGVSYQDSSGVFQGKLADSSSLYVKIYDTSKDLDSFPFTQTYPWAIELYSDSALTQPVVVRDDSYLEYTSDSTTTRYPISGYDFSGDTLDLSTPSQNDDGTVSKSIAAIDFDNGNVLVFHTGLYPQTGNLQDSTTYYAVVDTGHYNDSTSDYYGKIQLARSSGQAGLADPAIQYGSPQLEIPSGSGTKRIDIGNFQVGLGLLFSTDPEIADGTQVIYHAVPSKPMEGLQDGATYYAYNVTNVNDNPANPQYILTLMNAVDMSSVADSGAFQLTLTDVDGKRATTESIGFNSAASVLQDTINGVINSQSLNMPLVTVTGSGTAAAPWVLSGINVTSIAIAGSTLKQNGTATSLKE